MQSLGSIPDLPTLVEHVNAQHGTTYRVTERYLGGEQGAAGLTDANGNRFVLKWRPGATDLGRLPATIKTVATLRSRWYPVPRYVARGLHPAGAYSVQTMLPGAPIRRFSPAQIEHVLALNEIQRGLAPSPAGPPSPTPAPPAPTSESVAPASPSSGSSSPARPVSPMPGSAETASGEPDSAIPGSAETPAAPWPARVADDVLHGGDGYCLLDAMPAHAPETARLLDIVQGLVAQHQAVSTPTTDIVHYDFQPSNILTMSGKISGVVDWDEPLAGDRAFDLATLLFYTYDQDALREALWQRTAEITAPAAMVVYLAHLIHRQVDWSIRHHPPATADQWLERARVILADLPDRTGCAVPAWP